MVGFTLRDCQIPVAPTFGILSYIEMHTFHTKLTNNQLHRVATTRGDRLTIQVPIGSGPHKIPVSEVDAHRINRSKGKTVRIDLDVKTARGEGFLGSIIGGIKKVAKSVVKPVVKTLANTAIDKVLGRES